MIERAAYVLFVLVELVLCGLLVAINVSAYRHDWLTGLVVSVVVIAIFSLVWMATRDAYDEMWRRS